MVRVPVRLSFTVSVPNLGIRREFRPVSTERLLLQMETFDFYKKSNLFFPYSWEGCDSPSVENPRVFRSHKCENYKCEIL